MQPRSEPGVIDLAQFHQVFFEEAAEHLADLERLLVNLDVGAPAAEDLNAIFRAAHSIKGGSGTFGFHEMATVTHELESLLDRVRKGELALRPDMVDVLLAAADLLRAELAHYRGEAGAPDVDVDTVCARIRGCASGYAAASARDACPSPSASAALRELTLRFELPSDARPRFEALRAELSMLGTLQAAAAGPAGTLQTWHLTTAAGDAAIRDCFALIVDPARVDIASAAMSRDVGDASPVDSDFGFFDDAPGAPTPTCPQDDAQQGYGFFLPLTMGPESQPAPVAAIGPSEPDANVVPIASVAPAPLAQLSVSRTAPAAESSIRVGVDKVDEMINLVGELVITQAMLAQTAANMDPVANERLLWGLAQLERNTRDLQEAVMSVRMMPVAVVFNRFPRLVRDLAAKLGKEVELRTEGEGTELDKGLVEKIADPLTHLVRNSLDHGIESAEQRMALGKPAKGTILLKASHRGGSIVIEVSDDGAGLDRDKILAKASTRGMTVSDAMSDPEVWALIFEAGLSTAEVVTDVSGRGVGMDVVRRNIRELGGRVDIESAKGLGTRIAVRLPLTLAILDGMSVGVCGETFIVPLNHVIESLQVSEREVHSVSGAGRVISVRGEYVPLIDLRHVFGLANAACRAAAGVMVILESDGAATALLVDELLGQHQVVIKSLESNYRKVSGISGATIMGDGRVAMILDVPALVKMSRH